MVLPLIGKFSLGSFGFGAVAAAVGASVVRPILVGAVRCGYEASDLATETWHKAKAEAASLKTEALSTNRAKTLEAELQQLRDEVAALRSQSGAKRAS